MLSYHNDTAKNLGPVWERRFALNGEKQKAIAALLAAGVLNVDAQRGQIYSARNPRGKDVPLGCISAQGYRVCTIHGAIGRRQYRAHQIIWIAVHGPIPSGLVIDHIDSNKANNAISNLRLAGVIANACRRRSYAGAGNPAARITSELAQQIREHHKVSRSSQKTANLFNVSKSLVAQISRGDLWKS